MKTKLNCLIICLNLTFGKTYAISTRIEIRSKTMVTVAITEFSYQSAAVLDNPKKIKKLLIHKGSFFP